MRVTIPPLLKYFFIVWYLIKQGMRLHDMVLN